MPLFSEHISNMYYSGSPMYTSSSYGYSSVPLGHSYSASYLNPGGNYSTHSSLGSYSRTPLTSRWISGVGRNYSPILSSISERSAASPVRINSPRRIPITKRSYGSSGYISRPININTADIDVSKDKYRKKTESPVTSPPQRKDSPRNEKEKEDGPFMPRVDGKPETGIDSSPGVARSTIKRGRTVVRLHTIRRKERDSPRKPTSQSSLSQDGSDKKEAVNKVSQDSQNEAQESGGWRERLSDDLVYKDTKVKKTLGTKLAEKFMVKNNDKENTPGRELPINTTKNIQSPQSLPVTPLPSTSKSPERRCSMEILAEQSQLLDTLIRKENLSTTPLDLSKIGMDDEPNNNVNLFGPIKRRKSNDKNSPLQTTKSDHSLHDSMKSSHGQDIGKNFSKKRSLKKSASGGSICRLDSITEFPKEPLNIILPAIDESKPEIVNVKPNNFKPKLKTKITASVEVSTPKSPLKFRIDEVVVEEKPRSPKKEISYSSEVEENLTQAPFTQEKDESCQRNEMQIIKRKPKKVQPEPPSPEPEDGNFWNKIGKRETVYLMKRKQLLQEAKEKHKLPFFWSPEEESINENDVEEGKDTLQMNTGSNNSILTDIKDENKPNSVTSGTNISAGDCKVEISPKDSLINKATPQYSETKDSLKKGGKNEFQNETILKKVEDTPQDEPLKNIHEASSQKEFDLSKHLNNNVVKEEDLKRVENNKNTMKNDPTTNLSLKNQTEIAETVRKDDVINIKDAETITQIDGVEDWETKGCNKSIEFDQKNAAKCEVQKVSLQADETLINKDLEKLAPKQNELQSTCFFEEIEQPKKEVKSLDKSLEKEEHKVCVKGESNNVIGTDIASKKENIAETNKQTEMDESDINNQNITVSVETEKIQNESTDAEKRNEIPLVSEERPTIKKSIKKKTSSKKSASNKKVTSNSQEKISKNEISNKENTSCKTVEYKIENYDSQKQTNEFISHEKTEPTKRSDKHIKGDVKLGMEGQSLLKNSTEHQEESQAKHLKEASSSDAKNLDDASTSSSNDIPETQLVIVSENIPINKNDGKSDCSLQNLQQEETNNIIKCVDKKDQHEVKRPTVKTVVKLPELPVTKKPVKQEAALRPLIATPRPLQKRAPQVIHSSESSDSSSEEESSDEEDDECEASDDSEEFFECEANPDGRTSTGSNDSGFDSSAPTSPAGFQEIRKGGEAPGTSSTNVPVNNNSTDILEQELEQSTAYGIFKKTGRFTPPARSIPRFRKYTIEDFNFIKVLGKGSFGKVLLAELRDTEYYYAVKCLKKDVVLEDDDVECTLIERKVLALGTNHPYLCHLFATFQTDSHLFFVMEYLNGGDLMFHIQQSGRFPEARARFYAAEIVSGLKFLHKRGIIYRDLKLDNILLDFDGHVRIADFGMCKLQIYLDKTADTFCGTPDYMAPEIIKGLKYNQTVDWWSFGVLLYEMLIGQSPFSGCDEDELFWSICNEMPSYPRFLSQEALTILTRLLDKDARTRLGGTECMHGDIREQAFFSSVHWDRLDRRDLEAPFRPRVRHPLDTQYFDRAFTGERPRLTAVEPHVLRSMDQEPFRGFSYTNPNATDR